MSTHRTLSNSTLRLASASMLAAACALTLTLASAPAQADDYDAAIKDIQSTMG
ncbi:MAG: carboxymuconolactone decarboxylase family protein, partial [Mesorhizobium sp.]